ncbi:MAG: hypothetical protein COY94_07755 [Verrucomicrobia bacterium CG_4_10_14_0_8_um_filter_43_34]|nr:MAG: hypothetical protein COY94_07755 [Verrucomicrobia bacterium CG_4_10_14_0_8_um_filter_43_34]
MICNFAFAIVYSDIIDVLNTQTLIILMNFNLPHQDACIQLIAFCQENPIRSLNRLFNRVVEYVSNSELANAFSKDPIMKQARFTVEKWLCLRELGIIEDNNRGEGRIDLESQETDEALNPESQKDEARILDYKLSSYIVGAITTLGILYRLYDYMTSMYQFAAIAMVSSISFVICTYFASFLIHYREGHFSKPQKEKVE